MIRLVPDVGSPLTVAAVDIATMEMAPDWNEPASYIMAGGGMVAGVMNMGGDYVKNIGVAALPLAIRNLYTRFRSGAAGARTTKLALRKVASRVTRYPSPAFDPEFQGVTLD